MRAWGAIKRADGVADGILLLLSLLALLVSAATGVVCLTRYIRERSIERNAEAVKGDISGCGVSASRYGTRDRVTTYELKCTFVYERAAHTESTFVAAGYPSSRKAYDEWIERHPVPTAMVLWREKDRPTVLRGFDRIVPSTTTSRAAARTALSLAIVSLILFCASRLIVYRRTKPPG